MAKVPERKPISRIQSYLFGNTEPVSQLKHTSADTLLTRYNPQGTDTVPLPPVSFTLTSSVASVNEGGSVTFTMTTENVANDTTVPYTITGVSTSDIGGASLTGNFIINNGTASVTFNITADETTEGVETMGMISANQTVSVTINDTSTSPPTYALTRSAASVNEGGSVTFTMTTTNVVNGTAVPYTITGVSTADIGGASLTGNFSITNGTASVTFSITADTTTEGVETMTMTSAGQTVSVTINDTSLSLAGNVSTVAGSSQGYADGQGAAARFAYLRGCVVDSNDNLYIAEQNNNCVRKVTPSGAVTTFAGTTIAGKVDGPAATAQFWNPNGIAIDNSGNFYVADKNNHCIRKITPSGTVTTFAGTGDSLPFQNGAANVATFGSPSGLCVDASGNVYVADTENFKIRKITPSGDVTTFAGSGMGSSNGQGTAAEFQYPMDVIADSSGNVYVADLVGRNIRKITPSGNVTTFAGSETGVSGNVDGQGTAARFASPTGVSIDSSGNLYVADRDNGTVRKITPSGYVTTITGGAGGSIDGSLADARFSEPHDVAVTSSGDLFVTDLNRVRKIEFTAAPTYALTRSAASVNEGGSVTFTMTTTNVADGTAVPYTITGVSTMDIDESSLTGNFTINSNTASVTLDITSDTITEGTETLTMTSGGQTINVTINDTSTAPVTTRPLFNRSTFSVVPEPYRSHLNAAATRWENYIKMPDAVWDQLKAIRLAATGEDWNGLSLNTYTEVTYGVGNPNRGMIAACGSRNIYDIVEPGSTGLKFQPTGFALTINKYWETAIPSGETSPFEAADWIAIIAHELGHGLGIGGLWDEDFEDLGAVVPVNFFLDGVYSNAQQGYNEITGGTFTKMPLEDAGGGGTASAHWELEYRPGTALGANGVAYPGVTDELMIGYYTKGMTTKISKLTIGVLKDFGYEEVTPGVNEGNPTLDTSLVTDMNMYAKDQDNCHKLCCQHSFDLSDKECVGTIYLTTSAS